MRNLTKEIDRFARDGRFTVWNLPSQEYNATTVEHWLRYHFPALQQVHENGVVSGSDFDRDLHCIYLDLIGAIETLPWKEREAINLLIKGYGVHGRGNIAQRMKMDKKEMVDLLRNAYKLIAERLN